VDLTALKKVASLLPESPGVYSFKDSAGKIIYIGKANSLKKRVGSYFNRALDTKTQAMVDKIADLEYIPVSSEAQALIQEAVLIKGKQPQYNIDLKDDKSFPWIKISAEDFPVVSIYRKKGPRQDGSASYFGPYTDVKLLRQAIKLIRKIFGFRSCRAMPKSPCLYWRLKLCPGPCAGKITSLQYCRIIRRIKLFLESRYAELIRDLSIQMLEASGEKNFEEAAMLRDQLNALSSIANAQAGKNSVDELEDLQKTLFLKKLPLRVEAFDISNISGKEATGSMVSFYQGAPDKNNYRRFRIKTVSAIDDYAMLKEVVRRRYSRLTREGSGLPDLVLIDGGRGHLLAAAEEIKKLNLSLLIISIAKDRENIYCLNKRSPFRLKEGSAVLNLIRRIRDEAHRFALSYHHLLRRKKIIGK